MRLPVPCLLPTNSSNLFFSVPHGPSLSSMFNNQVRILLELKIHVYSGFDMPISLFKHRRAHAVHLSPLPCVQPTCPRRLHAGPSLVPTSFFPAASYFVIQVTHGLCNPPAEGGRCRWP